MLFRLSLVLLAQRPIAFTHVSVIDGSDSLPRADQTVVVRGNRIVSVTPGSSTPIPRGARVIDGRGKFLIPGLWDMHVHTAFPGGRALLPLYIANGVTGVRDMAGDWDTLTTWRTQIAHGELVGPRIIASGPYLEGGDVPIPHLLVRTPAEARAGVDSLVRLGVDFVKVHGQLTREVYFAIARRARERGIVFAGHVPRMVGAWDASDSGQKSIEHLLAVPLPCTVAESLALQPRFPVQSALGRCSSQKLTPLYARFVRNGTWVTPTLTAQVEVAGWPGHAVPGDSLAHYLPEAVQRYVAEIFPMPDSIPAGADSVGRAVFAKRQAQVGAMQRAGVGILTGTDAPLRNSPPGFGLHEELQLLVQGGMSPFAVLLAASFEPARYLGMLDSAGSIAAGKLADLVLLDANPLRDIRNTRRISAVMANGRLFDSTARRELLGTGARKSSSTSPPGTPDPLHLVGRADAFATNVHYWRGIRRNVGPVFQFDGAGGIARGPITATAGVWANLDPRRATEERARGISEWDAWGQLSAKLRNVTLAAGGIRSRYRRPVEDLQVSEVFGQAQLQAGRWSYELSAWRAVAGARGLYLEPSVAFHHVVWPFAGPALDWATTLRAGIQAGSRSGSLPEPVPGASGTGLPDVVLSMSLRVAVPWFRVGLVGSLAPMLEYRRDPAIRLRTEGSRAAALKLWLPVQLGLTFPWRRPGQ